MDKPPKWYYATAVVALLWNLIGCAAYLADVMLSPEAVAAMTDAQRTLYESRPRWAIAATAVAVWAGALGCAGLLARKSWSKWLLLASLAALVVQNVWLFGLSGAAAVDPTAFGLQGVVFAIAVGLVLLARRAALRGWIVTALLAVGTATALAPRPVAAQRLDPVVHVGLRTQRAAPGPAADAGQAPRDWLTGRRP